ncbi:MAG: GntR family transcriptional regulator [Amycolatopsis sp.]|jgi:DNA-binding FadR family transcriptional regulator|uniref:FadR/GntR family transcriptional regulator n=1 Tax=Amycolatopsis sp. TaxID=37632 RepID=UPI0026223D25|nr:FCD domain-containing protein [Amycolatopsis sp.]MCU1679949.1 GntR family transcriptional regulator [Amycolatopsis sp.]
MSEAADLAYDMPRRESRAESTAQAVERRIVQDRLEPGVRLGTRRELGELLGVAPQTVSEAIKLLEDRGRVVTKTGPRGGVFVAEPAVGVRLARSMMAVSGSENQVVEALEVRDILESAVIVHAAQAAHRAPELDGMLQALDRMRAATDTAEFYRRNLEFHAEIAELCDNEMLRTLYRGLLEIVQSSAPKLTPLPGQDPQKLRDGRAKVHADIADAIVRGDVTAARSAARAHAKHGRAVVARRP